MAIPFVAIEGYHTLLDSRAGRFVEEPTRNEPGWRALVEATAVVGVAEVDRGRVTGVTLVIHHPEVRSAGTVILVPGSLEVEGIALADMEPAEAVAAIGRTARLAIERVEVMDEAAWTDTLGDASYSVDSPDPVEDDAGGSLFTVGAVDVGGEIAAPFLGRPAPGASAISVTARRHALWNALVSTPPTTDAPLAADLRAMDSSTAQVVDVPMSQLQPVALLDPAGVESLVRDVVAYPVGAIPGDRVQIRILDRTGTADLEDIAAAVAARGMEVIEIGNAWTFDNGMTEIVLPVGHPAAPAATDPATEAAPGSSGPVVDDLAALAVALGVAEPTVEAPSSPEEEIEEGEPVVTLVVGRDFDLANLY